MQVIADLHGGDPEDASAKAEFREIKDRVNFDVSVFFLPCDYYLMLKPSSRSEHLARHAPTRSCGIGISAESCWLCPHRPSLNW